MKSILIIYYKCWAKIKLKQKAQIEIINLYTLIKFKMGGIGGGLVINNRISFQIKIASKCQFHTVETQNAIFISGNSQQQSQQLCPNHTQYKKRVTIKINKQKQKLTQKSVIVFENLYVYGCLDVQNKNVGKQQKLLINTINRDNKQKLFKQKRIKKMPGYSQISDVDYAIPINQCNYIQGYYNCLQPATITNYVTKQQKKIDIAHNYLLKIGKMGKNQDNIIVFQNNSFHGEQDYFSDMARLFDLNVESASWTCFDPLEFLYKNYIDVDNNCFILPHSDIFDREKSLYLHDTRVKNPVSLIDTNRILQLDFIHFQPNYLFLSKISQMKIAVQYRTPIRRHSFIMSLDIRKPLQKQILFADIDYPKYMYTENNGDNQYHWIVRNHFQNFKYQKSYIDRLQIF